MAFFTPTPEIVLRQYGGGASNVPDAAVEDRSGEADGVEHSAPADGQRVGLPIDAACRKFFQDVLYIVVLVLDRLAARHDHYLANQLHCISMNATVLRDAGK